MIKRDKKTNDKLRKAASDIVRLQETIRRYQIELEDAAELIVDLGAEGEPIYSYNYYNRVTVLDGKVTVDRTTREEAMLARGERVPLEGFKNNEEED